jgi:hypothetical protein
LGVGHGCGATDPKEKCTSRLANRRIRVLASGLLAVAAVCAALAHGLSASDREVAATVLAGLRNHVEMLDSGIVEIEVLDDGRSTLHRRFVAFDDRGAKVRCDLEDSVRGGRIVKVVHTETEFLQYLTRERADLLTRMNPGEESTVADGMPVDVRAVGLLQYSGLNLGISAEAVLDATERSKLVRVAVEGDIAVIVAEPDNPDTKGTQVTWWIDTSRDYVPIRTEVHISYPGARSVLRQRLETSWGRVDSIWVPLRSSFRVFDDEGGTQQYEDIRLTWKSVNKGVPEELFTAENLKLPKGTYVVDARLGEPIVEQVIGRERPLPDVPTPRPVSWMTWILIIGSGVALLAFVVLLSLRRLRRPAPSS